MTFKFECPTCQQRIAAESADAGIVSVCPSCGNQFTVPQPPPLARVVIEPSPPAKPATPPSQPLRSFDPSNLSFRQILIPLLLAGGVIVYLAMTDSKPGQSSSSGSSNSVSKIFEDRFTVTLPTGDIVTMTKSELEAYNKEQIRKYNADKQEMLDKVDASSRDIQRELDKFKTPSPPP